MVQPSQAAARSPTPRRSRARSTGTRPASPTTSTTPTSPTPPTARRTCPAAVVHDPFFDWGIDRPPAHGMHETIIYEAHVKGLTFRHPGVPEELRGTYAAHRPSGDPRAPQPPRRHRHRADAGAPVRPRPPPRRARAAQLLGLQLGRLPRPAQRLRQLPPPGRARAEPGAGVQDDGQGAPQRRHRGHPRRRLQPHRRGQPHGPDAVDARHRQPRLLPRPSTTRPATTSTSRGPATASTCATRTCCSSSWTACGTGSTEMHVDGFRFDLASTLARELYAVDRLSAFFDLVQQDPVVVQVKLIAEPWDVGEGGYQVGNFPPLWSEWNGRYRDTIRDFWRGEPSTLAEFGYRFTGSSDLYQADTRRPTASVNFVTAHDGFPLADLVVVQRQAQRGQRRGQPRRRVAQPLVELRRRRTDRRPRRPRPAGAPAAQPVHHAAVVPGRADDPRRRRARPHPGREQQRLLPGQRDLVVRLGGRRPDFLAFCRTVTAAAPAHPVFRRRRWFQGAHIRGLEDLAWLRPDAEPMSEDDWDEGLRPLRRRVPQRGRPSRRRTRYGGRVVDDSFLLLFNASELDLPWTPARRAAGPRRGWSSCDTSEAQPHGTVLGPASRSRCRSVVVVLRSLEADARPGRDVVCCRGMARRDDDAAAARAVELGVETSYWDVSGQRHHAVGRDAGGPSSTCSRTTAAMDRRHVDPVVVAAAGLVADRRRSRSVHLDDRGGRRPSRSAPHDDDASAPRRPPVGCHRLVGATGDAVEECDRRGRPAIACLAHRQLDAGTSPDCSCRPTRVGTTTAAARRSRHLRAAGRRARPIRGSTSLSTLPLYAAFLDDPFDPSPYAPSAGCTGTSCTSTMPSSSCRDDGAHRLGDSHGRGCVDWRSSRVADDVSCWPPRRRWRPGSPTTSPVRRRRPDVDAFARFQAGAGSPTTAARPRRPSHAATSWPSTSPIASLPTSRSRPTPCSPSTCRSGATRAGYETLGPRRLFATGMPVGAPAGRVLRRRPGLGLPAAAPRRRPASGHAAVVAARRPGGRARLAAADRPRDGRPAAVVDPDGRRRGRWRVRALSPRGVAGRDRRRGAAHAARPIVGEDLGTVSDEVREALERWDVIGMYEEQFHLAADPLPQPAVALRGRAAHPRHGAVRGRRRRRRRRAVRATATASSRSSAIGRRPAPGPARRGTGPVGPQRRQVVVRPISTTSSARPTPHNVPGHGARAPSGAAARRADVGGPRRSDCAAADSHADRTPRSHPMTKKRTPPAGPTHPSASSTSTSSTRAPTATSTACLGAHPDGDGVWFSGVGARRSRGRRRRAT